MQSDCFWSIKQQAAEDSGYICEAITLVFYSGIFPNAGLEKWRQT